LPAISVFSILGDTSYYRRDFDLDREDWRAATSYVLDRAQPEDGAFFYANFGRLPFDFYRSQRHPSPRWPEALVAANGKDWGYRDSLFAYLGEACRMPSRPGDRVWLVLSFNNSSNGEPNRETAMLRAVYGKGRRLMEEKRISTITILLYARDSTASAQTSGEKSSTRLANVGLSLSWHPRLTVFPRRRGRWPSGPLPSSRSILIARPTATTG